MRCQRTNLYIHVYTYTQTCVYTCAITCVYNMFAQKQHRYLPAYMCIFMYVFGLCVYIYTHEHV